MKLILKRVLISFGLALIIGATVGYVQSEEKYYLLDDGERIELTKAQMNKKYKDHYKHSRKDILTESIYNNSAGIVSGLASFGGLLVISMLIKKRD